MASGTAPPVPATMRAVVLTRHGGLDALTYRTDVPVPRPGPDDVLVRVTACGMNATDINTRTGWYATSGTAAAGDVGGQTDEDGSWGGRLSFPRIQGAAVVGRIVTVGPGVAADRIGQRVMIDGWLRDPSGARERARYLGSEVDGGYGDYVAVPASNAHAVDAHLSDIELATFPCAYATAEHMLHRAGVAAGHWVLVTGASGGVGGGLVQLARRRAARVVALTSAHHVDDVRDLGADAVLDRTRADLATAVADITGGVDVFADVVGGPLFAPLFDTIRPGGHYTTAGAIAGPVVALDLRTLYLRDLTMHGATVLPPEVFANLVAYIERGEIRPVVARTFPLEDMVAAQAAFVERADAGGIVIDVAADRV